MFFFDRRLFTVHNALFLCRLAGVIGGCRTVVQLSILIYHDNLPFLWDCLYPFLCATVALIVHLLGLPTRARADRLTIILWIATLAFGANVFIKHNTEPSFVQRYLETAGCTLHTKYHYEPDGVVTWDSWATGRWCQSTYKQSMTIGRGQRKYVEQSDRCYSFCAYHVAEHGGRLHGFMPTSPADRVPESRFCEGEQTYYGNCPEHPRFDKTRRLVLLAIRDAEIPVKNVSAGKGLHSMTDDYGDLET
ncbi:hypothetical protein BDY17DRAFT_324647 [Neohortaea acidophila]|uniref:Uncharacterized protein n=1 Tax=Neohortaea acidophila TaxID=245834 RepID=A0A6A6PQL9_9PEZI|nr:uncharacterized protein BDY17DRAFT_324647 [Neohortaea acidophila]KAF2482359.1 hypothetical protein BDY17DRAFT_324647 [Neohortaea acidophila]